MLGRTDIAVIAVACAGFAAIVAFVPQRARGQDAQHHHPLHHDFYRHWLQPGTGISCCDARVMKDGVEVGDCEPTDAKVVNGQWWAYLRQEQRYVPVPDDVILREKNPTQGGTDGHLCYNYGRVLCFVPPFGGG